MKEDLLNKTYNEIVKRHDAVYGGSAVDKIIVDSLNISAHRKVEGLKRELAPGIFTARKN
jgi:hypothetical protein